MAIEPSHAKVRRDQRYTRRNPCPVCSGGDDDPRGRGVRCDGFAGDNGLAYCTREEYAGALKPLRDGRTYAHRLDGPCGCAVSHTQEAQSAASRANTRFREYAPIPYEELTGPSGYRLTRIYRYLTAIGDIAFEVRRYERASDGDKQFRMATPRGGGQWIPQLEADRVLYQLPALVKSPPDAPVVFVEGEKCVEITQTALRAAGVEWVVTTTPGGNGQVSTITAETLALLAGRRIVILPDHDADGEHYAATIAERAREAGAAQVKLLHLDDLEPKGDVADWLAGGHDGAELVRCIEAVLAGPSNEDASLAGVRDREGEDEPSALAWPTLDDRALYGLAGEIVRTIEPHTEADPVALLAQLLAYAGNAIGRTAYFPVEATAHHTNLFVTLVGNTSKARKGTSQAWVDRVFTTSDEELEAWRTGHILSGLSSGEGLIHHLRDSADDNDTFVTDLMRDKRALVCEAEFGGTLRVMGRQGSTLSAVIRNGWDGRPLATLTKHIPEQATGTHISIVGHVTREELLRFLSATDMSNGFGNRFLWFAVQRARSLPLGGSLQDTALDPYRDALACAIRTARQRDMVCRDGDADALWCDVYEELSEGGSGAFGEMTSRSEAQTMRLALLYALLDKSPTIRRAHLEAALALWHYAEASARMLFTDRSTNPVAETIMRGLRKAEAEGLTRTQISHLFGGHKKAEDIDLALKQLREQRRADYEQEVTNGRSLERWRSAKYAKEAKRAGARVQPHLVSSLSSLNSQFACANCGGTATKGHGEALRCATCDVSLSFASRQSAIQASRPAEPVASQHNGAAPVGENDVSAMSEPCPVTGGAHKTAKLRTPQGWLKCTECEAVTDRRAPDAPPLRSVRPHERQVRRVARG